MTSRRNFIGTALASAAAASVPRVLRATDHVRFDEALWREVTAKLAEEGCNTLVIDLGEALAYPSHPELAKGYWSLRTFVELDRHGFEQVPTGSNYQEKIAANFGNLVDFCDRHVSPKGIRGYLQTPWCPTLPKYRDRLLEAAKLLGETIRRRDPAKAAASYDPKLNGFLPAVTAESDRKVYGTKEEEIKKLFWPGY